MELREELKTEVEDTRALCCKEPRPSHLRADNSNSSESHACAGVTSPQSHGAPWGTLHEENITSSHRCWAWHAPEAKDKTKSRSQVGALDVKPLKMFFLFMFQRTPLLP